MLEERFADVASAKKIKTIMKYRLYLNIFYLQRTDSL